VIEGVGEETLANLLPDVARIDPSDDDVTIAGDEG
jgi:hypothetical protein